MGRGWTAARFVPAAVDLSDEELLDLPRSVVETVATEAVVGDRAGLRDGHEARGTEQGQVMLDRRLREVQLLGDLGQVEVPGREQLQDPEPRLVAERPVEPHDGQRRR